MTPAQYCEDRARGAGSSFFYAFLFLPEEKRRAMMALYAFCREVDDIADEVHDTDVAMRKLRFWREEIARAFDGNPTHPIGCELGELSRQHRLSSQLFSDIMDGMCMDIAHSPIATDADLGRYCYRVAGAVGLLSAEIFGCSDAGARAFACTLGEALQRTNILRDLQEDAARGRIYIPREARIRFGVSDEDFMDGHFSEGMQALLEHYGQAAAACYARALTLLPETDREALGASLIMGAIYHAHLKRLQAARFDVWRHPVRLLPAHKMWIAWRAWRYEKRARRRGTPPRFDF